MVFTSQAAAKFGGGGSISRPSSPAPRPSTPAPAPAPRPAPRPAPAPRPVPRPSTGGARPNVRPRPLPRRNGRLIRHRRGGPRLVPGAYGAHPVGVAPVSQRCVQKKTGVKTWLAVLIAFFTLLVGIILGYFLRS